MRTRGAGEVCQAPRENQQQRPESRHEKGGIQQTMPVSFSCFLPPTIAHPSDLFKRETSAVIRRLYMFHEEEGASVGAACHDASVSWKISCRLSLYSSPLRLPRSLTFPVSRNGKFFSRPREKWPGRSSPSSHSVSILKTSGNTPFSVTGSLSLSLSLCSLLNCANCDIREVTGGREREKTGR